MRYLPVIAMGIWCAQTDFLEKLRQVGNKSRLKKACKYAILVILLLIFGYARQAMTDLQDICDAVLSLLFVYLCYDVLSKIKFISSGLAFLGKYSMNMFLTHTFIYLYYFKNFLYSFKYAAIILIVLLAITLPLSILLERLKKIIKLDSLARWLTKLFTTNTPILSEK